MKKLLCVALFSIALMANASEKKEILTNNSNDIKVEKTELKKGITIEKNDFEEVVSEETLFFGCSGDGNELQDSLIEAGSSHRDARAERREFVRHCRGTEDGWIADILGHYFGQLMFLIIVF